MKYLVKDVDTDELRKISNFVYLASDATIARDLHDKLNDAADEIDYLRMTVEELRIFDK